MRFRTRRVFRSPLLRATAALIHSTSALIQGEVAGGFVHQTKDDFFHGDMAIHQSGHKANRVHCNYIADFCVAGSVRQLQSVETLSQHVNTRAVPTRSASKTHGRRGWLVVVDVTVARSLSTRWTNLERHLAHSCDPWPPGHVFYTECTSLESSLINILYDTPTTDQDWSKDCEYSKNQLYKYVSAGISNEQYFARFMSNERPVIVIGYGSLPIP